MPCVSSTASKIYLYLEQKLIRNIGIAWQCIDSLVFHFLRYAATANAEVRAGTTSASVARSLPVIFHQCLLSFAERYRNDSKWISEASNMPAIKTRTSANVDMLLVTEDQREALLDLLLNYGHEKIAPEIRKELLAGRGRGVPLEEDGPAFDGDDTMVIDS